MLPGKAVLYMQWFCMKNQGYDGKRNWCIQEPIQRLIILIPVGTNLSTEKKNVSTILCQICSKVHKVEKFKKSQAKEDALHAKYNLSKSLLLN